VLDFSNMRLSALISGASGFAYRAGELCCEEVSLASLAEKFDTPLYVYSAGAIRERFAVFDRAFSHVPHTICYSVKANSNLSILKLLAALGSGFDVVSGGELQRVLCSAPRQARQVVFSGVGKTAAEIDAALREQILLFNVESESELTVLAQRAARMRKKARIALRVNPDVPAKTHPYISTGLRQHKFGVPIAEARRLYRQASQEKWLEVAGVSAHIGSQIMDFAPFRAVSARLAELTRELRSDGLAIRYVDVGGGFGIPYAKEESSADLSRRIGDYARAVSEPLRKLDIHLLLEPGRVIMGPSGALLTRVIYVKQQNKTSYLIVDAGMNDLLRPALYGARHKIAPITCTASPESVRNRKYDIVGPICETADIFARGVKLPEITPGVLLAILDAGAYGMSLASNYNSRPRAAEVLVTRGSARLIRRREKIGDLVRAETQPDAT
jgi:diaminopimelate decarboxylase